MTALRYVKGVRTRYINSLEKEINSAKDILNQDLESVDIIKTKNEVNTCVQMLKKYSDKVEIQCEKYISALGENENDEKEIDKVMDEDMSLCDRATRYVSLLEQLSTDIVSQLADKKDTEEKVLPAQDELKSFMLEQSLRQREFTERQSAQQHEFMEYIYDEKTSTGS